MPGFGACFSSMCRESFPGLRPQQPAGLESGSLSRGCKATTCGRLQGANRRRPKVRTAYTFTGAQNHFIVCLWTAVSSNDPGGRECFFLRKNTCGPHVFSNRQRFSLNHEWGVSFSEPALPWEPPATFPSQSTHSAWRWGLLRAWHSRFFGK